MAHTARLVLGLTFLAVAVLALVPIDAGGGYSCVGPPVARLVDPDVELGSEEFFDVGAACNRDARGRGRAMAATAVVGLGSSGALALAARRRRQSAEAAEGHERVPSLW